MVSCGTWISSPSLQNDDIWRCPETVQLYFRNIGHAVEKKPAIVDRMADVLQATLRIVVSLLRLEGNARLNPILTPRSTHMTWRKVPSSLVGLPIFSKSLRPVAWKEFPRGPYILQAKYPVFPIYICLPISCKYLETLNPRRSTLLHNFFYILHSKQLRTYPYLPMFVTLLAQQRRQGLKGYSTPKSEK